MKRNGQCHCGSLRVVAMGDPERVDLCHCKACQCRPGTAFHLGATYLKARVRLEGDRQIYEREADTGYRIRFHFCPNCGRHDLLGGGLQSCRLRGCRRRVRDQSFPAVK